ncbi:hypothetical protein E2C01_036912 [Portunus trituberculatus]|uniref:Uncharacterized protein n=1 Tax=Portunus trituberculatus TaxID=210409 RepID=A0A5B7FDC3_PORTR|nr:hypothetical protein [Portunus trituberculatus]
MCDGATIDSRLVLIEASSVPLLGLHSTQEAEPPGRKGGGVRLLLPVWFHEVQFRVRSENVLSRVFCKSIELQWSCGELGIRMHRDICVLSSAMATTYHSYMPPLPKTPNSPKAPKLIGGLTGRRRPCAAGGGRCGRHAPPPGRVSLQPLRKGPGGDGHSPVVQLFILYHVGQVQ